ncbi:hypothetical protein [Alkalihalobacillus sp. AL-G]|uniref:hypothetical protein n=1 Tax=Alkalihalobacillus sp. AL-G TaxID=2926399 RepID=UPI00272CF316|nr:hypothetical protein [Alkalihalobacillus sp. AL-G]WLD92368.1 hypothetical protein MOJ78_15280 [Alkalihalobacillus sp. AL-G]
MTCSFVYDNRLGIKLPELEDTWEDYSKYTQESILSKWESIRGTIPDRIKDIEEEINNKQEQLNAEENFERSCQLNSDIADLASVINDLWIWYRTQNHVSLKVHH